MVPDNEQGHDVWLSLFWRNTLRERRTTGKKARYPSMLRPLSSFSG